MIRGAAHFRRYPRNEGARGPLMRKSVFEQPIAFAVRARDLFVSSNKLRAKLIVPADYKYPAFFSLRRVRAEVFLLLKSRGAKDRSTLLDALLRDSGLFGIYAPYDVLSDRLHLHRIPHAIRPQPSKGFNHQRVLKGSLFLSQVPSELSIVSR